MPSTESEFKLLLGKPPLPQRILEPTPDFHTYYNHLPFMFSHNLAGHPLMQLPRLVELAKTLIQYGPSNIRCQVSKMPKHLKWTDATLKEQFQEKLPEFIANIEQSDSTLMLYMVQRDPAYKALLDQILDELEELTEQPLRKEISWADAHVFIASPYGVTPYHIDHEATFLLQVHGDRQADVYDGRDRTVVLEEEVERFYIGDSSAASYRAENQAKAYTHALTPGKGVHHPVLAPHCYQNGDRYSVAFGISFHLKSEDRRARVYQANHYLRKLGFQPTPPGQSVIKDALKSGAIGLFCERNPQSKPELLYSGIRRIRRMVSTVVQPVRRIRAVASH